MYHQGRSKIWQMKKTQLVHDKIILKKTFALNRKIKVTKEIMRKDRPVFMEGICMTSN